MLNLIKLFFSFALFFSFSFARAETKILKVGAIITLSGQWAAEGEAFMHGIELAADELRAQGKFEPELIFEDSEFVRPKIVSAAKKLVTQNNVDLLITGTLGETKPNFRFIEQEKIPTIVLWDSTPELEAAGDYIFGIGPWAPASGEFAADFALTKLKINKFAIFMSASEWPEYVAGYFTKRVQQSPGATVESYSFLPDQGDFRPSIMQAKAKGVQAIYFPLDFYLLSFLKQAQQLAPEIKLITSDIISENIIQQGGKTTEGAYSTGMNFPDSPGKVKFIEDYTKKYGKQCLLCQFSGWGYDAVMMAVKAYEDEAKANSKLGARELIKQGLYKIGNFDGVSGQISISSGGSWKQLPQMYQVKDAKLVLIE
jgi:ABC-type branched-subunit amino acid transport system substrate-binding protein